MTRLPLLLLTATVAGIGGVAQAVDAASNAGAAPQTRLGKEISGELAGQAKKEAARRQALDLREAALKAAQARMAKGTEAAPPKAAKPGGAAAATGPDPAEQRYAELAKIYQAMKPARAAAVLEKLSPEVQLKVAQNMRSRNAGLIMAQMSPTGAASLSMAMAKGEAVRTVTRPGNKPEK